MILYLHYDLEKSDTAFHCYVLDKAGVAPDLNFRLDGVLEFILHRPRDAEPRVQVQHYGYHK